jgi:uncharacterized protein YpmB
VSMRVCIRVYVSLVNLLIAPNVDKSTVLEGKRTQHQKDPQTINKHKKQVQEHTVSDGISSHRSKHTCSTSADSKE